jgi:hypothetical protein
VSRIVSHQEGSEGEAQADSLTETSPQRSRPNEEYIKRLHHQLMLTYVYVIETVSRPGKLPRGVEPSTRPRPIRRDRPEVVSRGLWLLFVPFVLLLNVPFYITPRPQERDSDSTMQSLLREVRAAVQRLFALTVTGILVLSVSGVAMDLVGWQCGGVVWLCVVYSWLPFLTEGFLSLPHRQLAVMSLVPAAAVALLWLPLQLPRSLDRTKAGSSSRLGTRVRSWASQVVLMPSFGSVDRLRAAHVTGGFSLIAVLLLAPLAHRSGIAQTMLVIHLLVIATVVAAVAWFHIADRTAPWWINRVPMVAAALYGLTAYIVFLLRIDGYQPAMGGLPWFTRTVRWTLVAQAVLLIVLAVLTIAIAASTRRMARPKEVRKAASGHQGEDLVDRRFGRWSGRPVTRILVESHVKGKLKELQVAYVQIEQALPDDDSFSDFRQWLKELKIRLLGFRIH